MPINVCRTIQQTKEESKRFMRKLAKYFIGICALFTAFFAVGCGDNGFSAQMPHEHVHSDVWASDDTYHYHVCTDCEQPFDKSAHSGGVATCTRKAVCTVCGEEYGDLLSHSGGVATCTQKAKCEVCGEEYGDLLPHEYIVIQKDEDTHWLICAVCEAVDENSITAHFGGMATCTQRAICADCGTAYGEVAEHVYAVIKYDECHHWTECVCGRRETDINEMHFGGEASCQERPVCTFCQVAYGERGDHKYTITEWDKTCHWNVCACGARDEDSKEMHSGGDATCTQLATCQYCNQPYGEHGDHKYTATEWDETCHWNVCTCGKIDEDSKQTHSGGDATCTQLATCQHCNQPYGELEKHNYLIVGKDTTHTWLECLCGDIDESSKKEIEETIPPTTPDTGNGNEDNETIEPPPTEPDTGNGGVDNEMTETPPTEPDKEAGAEEERPIVEGNGSRDTPYVLFDGCTFRMEMSGYTQAVYFVYEAWRNGVASFTNLENFNTTALECGTDWYSLVGIDPDEIGIEGWDTYYFVVYANTAGEMSFKFVIEK